jgi:hypothetical protein
MRQVFYIEPDEEMISIIGRLRKSTASENVIVVPHHSLIFQSIVNVRLLDHDARKNKKDIVIVTQDEQSRSLCEKVGIRTQVALDDHEVPPHNAVASSGYAPSIAAPLNDRERTLPETFRESNAVSGHEAPNLPHSDTIGSDNFFDVSATFAPSTKRRDSEPAFVSGSVPSMDARAKTAPTVKPVIRDKTPRKLTALNSRVFVEREREKKLTSFTPPSLRGSTESRPVFTPLPISVADHPALTPIVAGASRSDAAARHPLWFLARRKEAKDPIASDAASVERSSRTSSGTPSTNGKFRAWVIFFGMVSIVSAALVGAYVLLPEATVRVKLKTLTQQSDFEFDGSSKLAGYSTELRALPARLIEFDQEMTLSFETTGNASLSDQKARGTVTLFNSFGNAPQTLVASTRLLAQNGKVFRLVSGVTVPGMQTTSSGIVSGSVEAAVIADQSGAEYNIGPSDFSIPGFSGSPKYEKFSAVSSGAMIGGGSNGSEARAVSESDVVSAKKTMDAKLKSMARDVMVSHLELGERALDEAIETSVLSSNAFPQAGVVTNTFDYRATVHIRTLAFSENDLKIMIADLLAAQDEGKESAFLTDTIELQYGEPAVDFATEILRIKVHAIGRSESKLDTAAFRDDLLGQKEVDLPDILKKYTQIDTVSIELWPDFLAERVPTRESRVTISVE